MSTLDLLALGPIPLPCGSNGLDMGWDWFGMCKGFWVEEEEGGRAMLVLYGITMGKGSGEDVSLKKMWPKA